MSFDTQPKAYRNNPESVPEDEAELWDSISRVIEAYSGIMPFPDCSTMEQFLKERRRRSLMAQIWRADAPSREKKELEESKARIRYVSIKQPAVCL